MGWRFRKYLFPCFVIIAGGGVEGNHSRGKKMKGCERIKGGIYNGEKEKSRWMDVGCRKMYGDMHAASIALQKTQNV